MFNLLKKIFHFRHLIVSLLSMGLIWCFFQIAINISFFNPIARSLSNFNVTDIFYEIDNTENEVDTCEIITLVDMTNVYDRGRLAEIIDSIRVLEPAVLGIDIMFDGWKCDSFGNERLIEVACQEDGTPIIWAYKLKQWNDTLQQYNGAIHSFFCDYIDVDEGFTNVQRDVNGGTVRSFGISRSLGDGKVCSLPAKVASAFFNDSSVLTRPTDCNINYRKIHFPVLQPESITDNKELIREHIVLLGAMNDMQDMHYTPLGQISGLQIIAYTARTLTMYDSSHDISGWPLWLCTFFLIWMARIFLKGCSFLLRRSSLPFLSYLGVSTLTTTILAFIFISILTGICYILFNVKGIFFNIAWTMMGIALLGNAQEIYNLIVHIYKSFRTDK